MTAVPAKGAIHDGPTILAKGDRIDGAALARLTYDPEDAAAGAAGNFAYTVDDGHGASAQATVRIEVIDGAQAAVSQVAATATPPAAPETVRGIALEPVSGRYIARSDINVRDGPSPSANRIDRIAKGTEVQVLGKAEGANWFSIATANGDAGFVASELLEPVAPEARRTLRVNPSAAAPEEQAVAPAESIDRDRHGAVDGGSVGTAAGEFADCTDCPVMVSVPAGEFVMGNDKGDGSERPPHRVAVKSFAIGQVRSDRRPVAGLRRSGRLRIDLANEHRRR